MVTKKSASTKNKKAIPEQGDLFTQERPKANTANPEEFLSLGIYAERAYLDYAISVSKGAHFQKLLMVKSRCNVAFSLP